MTTAVNTRVYLQCSECNYGIKYQWTMTADQYYNGGFINRVCPKCGFQDIRNTMQAERQYIDKSKGIFLKAIDY